MLNSWWIFLFGIILLVLWVISGGFVTQANVLLTPSKNIDDFFKRAYWATFAASFITWFLIAIFLLLVVLSVALLIFGASEVAAVVGTAEAGFATAATSIGVETITIKTITKEGAKYLKDQGVKYIEKQHKYVPESGINWFILGFLIFALVLVAITGVLSAIAASSMTKSPRFSSQNADMKKAHNDCVIAAILCLGTGSIIIIGLVIYFIIGIIQTNNSQKIANKLNSGETIEEIQGESKPQMKEETVQQLHKKVVSEISDKTGISQDTINKTFNGTLPVEAQNQVINTISNKTGVSKSVLTQVQQNIIKNGSINQGVIDTLAQRTGIDREIINQLQQLLYKKIVS